MSEETIIDPWLTKLFDDISVVLTENKSVKFNTHANRKKAIKKIQDLVKEAVEQNTVKKEVNTFSRYSKSDLAHPNPNPSEKQITVMSEALSSIGDDPSFRPKIDGQNIKKGVRSW